jgi:hypothetical protein
MSQSTPPPNQLSLKPPARYTNSLRQPSQLSRSFSNARYHPYQSGVKDNDIQEILSPALSQQHNNPSSSSLDHLPMWHELASVLANAVGPFKVPTAKLTRKKYLRPHSVEDVAALAVAIERNDQRCFYPIVVEANPDIVNDADFMSILSKINKLDPLPNSILDACESVGFVVQGVKRYRACRILEDRCVYAKFIPPGKTLPDVSYPVHCILCFQGTFNKYRNIFEARIVHDNSMALQTVHSVIDILLTVDQQLGRLSYSLTHDSLLDFKATFKEISDTVKSMITITGSGGAESEIRKAKEFAKRSVLMDALKYLGKSSLFREVWKPNMFKTFSEWDLTVSLLNLVDEF